MFPLNQKFHLLSVKVFLKNFLIANRLSPSELQSAQTFREVARSARLVKSAAFDLR
jgi:hypothetical protein